MLQDAEVERALAVTAHPDDVDFGAGGTVAAWTDAGIEVSYCICTDGDAGGFDPEVAREGIPALRRAEQTAAAKEVGVQDLHFLGYPDGELAVTRELRRDISRVIRRVRPQRMLIQSPERNWEFLAASHPDHLAAGEAATVAIYPDARNPYAHPALLRDEGLADWVVHEVWISGHPGPDHWVDVTGTFERKLAALRSHASQTSHVEDLELFLRERLAANARLGGLPEGHLAEAFKRIWIN
jgi:LmbE family N-acetylglucosaminyl deacetylase